MRAKVGALRVGQCMGQLRGAMDGGGGAGTDVQREVSGSRSSGGMTCFEQVILIILMNLYKY